MAENIVSFIVNDPIVKELVQIAIGAYVIKQIIEFAKNPDIENFQTTGVKSLIALAVLFGYQGFVDLLVTPVLDWIMGTVSGRASQASPISDLIAKGKTLADGVYGRTQGMMDKNTLDRFFYVLEFILRQKLIAPIFAPLGILTLAACSLYVFWLCFKAFAIDKEPSEGVVILVQYMAALAAIGVLNPNLFAIGGRERSTDQNAIVDFFRKIEEKGSSIIGEEGSGDSGATGSNTGGLTAYVAKYPTMLRSFTYYFFGWNQIQGGGENGATIDGDANGCKSIGATIHKKMEERIKTSSEREINSLSNALVGGVAEAWLLDISTQLGNGGQSPSVRFENNGLYMPFKYHECSDYIIQGVLEATDVNVMAALAKVNLEKPTPQGIKESKESLEVEKSIVGLMAAVVLKQKNDDSASLDALGKNTDTSKPGASIHQFAGKLKTYNEGLRDLSLKRITASLDKIADAASAVAMVAEDSTFSGIYKSAINLKISVKGGIEDIVGNMEFIHKLRPYFSAVFIYIGVGMLFMCWMMALVFIPLVAAKAYMLFVVHLFLLPVAAYLLLPSIVLPGQPVKLLKLFMKTYLPKAFYIPVFIILMTPVMAMVQMIVDGLGYILNYVG